MLQILNSFDIKDSLVSIIKRLWNIDITNFTHVVDFDGVNHILKRHGKKSTDKKENIVEDVDIENIESIINNAEEIVAGGLSGTRKLPTILYITYTKTHKVYYVEEILKNKKELRVKTLFKNKLK